jgi:hypothetical protein
LPCGGQAVSIAVFSRYNAGMTQIRIYAEPLHGHWTAWVEGMAATHSCGGDTAASALLRLLKRLDIAPEQIEADVDACYGDRS